MHATISKPILSERVNILGVHVGTMTADELLLFIIQSVESGNKNIVAYLNIHAINLAQKHRWFKQFLNSDCITYCDGFGIMLGASILGLDIPERYSIPDWFPRLASDCSQKKISMYFLGARPGVADKAAQRLCLEYPGLRILGTHHGYFDTTERSEENDRIIQLINRLTPDILVIGLGMPAQERWLMKNWSALEYHVALPVGAGLDYLAGDTPRAPHWMTDHGLEWLGRLLVEPRRLWRRYLVGIPTFLLNIFKQRLGLFPLD